MSLLTLLAVVLALGYLAHRGTEWNRERRRVQAEKLAVCAQQGHDYGPVLHALDSPWWPYQQCSRCGHQEHHKRCSACGKVIDKGKVVECGSRTDDQPASE